MVEYDPGPPPNFADLFANHPDYTPHKDLFWHDWGPIIYRGRLDGSARILCVASDPGATERIAMRTLVGDAGQRVQGFFAKLGLTRSYLCLNAFIYGLPPNNASRARPILNEPGQVSWRNALFDEAKTPSLQAVIAFGRNAQRTVELWNTRGDLPVFNLPHPTSHDPIKLATAWREAIPALRAIVQPDSDGDPTLPNYGNEIVEADYARVPLGDLPFGVPEWLGDDSWRRLGNPPGRGSVSRPQSDIMHSIVWKSPTR